MTSEAIEESGVNVFMFALALGRGTARRFESKPTDANEPSDIGQVKPGRRTAKSRLVYYSLTMSRAQCGSRPFHRILSECVREASPIVIPGWSEGPDPESRD